MAILPPSGLHTAEAELFLDMGAEFIIAPPPLMNHPALGEYCAGVGVPWIPQVTLFLLHP